ncbi:GFA family protein [Sabulicella glaciei]|uniref:GFA family protein n=1 Tax=Sabulicella glaciei TaxID=2984948 RepID=A0ABT3NZE4_9PROT|nr:GFA family protein [Roseococcus sp. MDT2-1-1]MCW8087537.1 GFA family protein [Roseococcus sp. MDT2-1-1]
MTFPREGGCQCGAIRYVVDEPPKLIFACHCKDCQRRSGAAVVVSLIVRDQAFRITNGHPTPQRRTNDQGRVLEHWFCADCGTPLLGMARGTTPNLYQTVRVGTMDDVAGLSPSVHVWTRSAQDWVSMPSNARCFEGNPPGPLLALAE